MRRRSPSEWKQLLKNFNCSVTSSHVGAEKGVNCEHMQALVTNIFPLHCLWQEDRRVDLQPGRFRYNTAFTASLDM